MNSGSRRGRWDGWDWMVSAWVMLLDWLFELAQWVIANVVPAFKNGTVQGSILAGAVFGITTLLIRLLRNNEFEKRGGIFPLTPPPGWSESSGAEDEKRNRMKKEKK